jgi:osmotically-inducible protein OsmY
METPATTFTPVIKFHFGADARDAEGAGATLTHVALTGDGRAITAVGVKFGLFSHTIYAPIERVASATDAGIEFNVTRAEIEKDGLQPDGIRLSGGVAVTQTGKRIGKLAQMSFNADTHALRHIVVERGLGNAVVSADSIAQITANGIALAAPRNGAGPTMTPYRLDADLRDDAIRAIESYGRLRVDMDGVNITATDGVIWLRGFVSSELNRRLIGDLVSEVHGLGELHNELITDQEVAASISNALARDPRTAEEHIGVYPMLGHVRLRGVVHTAIAREAAEQVATSVPGVGKVSNELRVNADANVLPVLSGVTNDEDAVPGGR